MSQQPYVASETKSLAEVEGGSLAFEQRVGTEGQVTFTVSGTPEVIDLAQRMLLALVDEPAGVLARRLRVLSILAEDMTNRAGRDEEIIRTLAATAIPDAPRVLQLRRNASAREQLITEFGLYSSHTLAELRNAETENVSAAPSRWSREGRIFDVPPIGDRRFPGFQFDSSGRPLPILREIIATLGPLLEGWELALWFTASNASLDGARPADLLERAPESVREAARFEVESAASW